MKDHLTGEVVSTGSFKNYQLDIELVLYFLSILYLKHSYFSTELEHIPHNLIASEALKS